MCTKGRDVISTSYSLALTRNSLFKTNNSNHLSPPCYPFLCFPPFLNVGSLLCHPQTNLLFTHISHKQQNHSHSEYSIVARVRPRASKGITDLLLPLPSFNSFTIKCPSTKSHVILPCPLFCPLCLSENNHKEIPEKEKTKLPSHKST